MTNNGTGIVEREREKENGLVCVHHKNEINTVFDAW